MNGYDFPALDPARFEGRAKTRLVDDGNGPRLEVDAEQYKRLAHWACEKFLARYSHLRKDREDCHAEAMVGLMKACRGFDPSRSTFVTYGSDVVWKHLYRIFIDDQMVGKRRCRQKVCSLNAPTQDHKGSGGPRTLAEQIADKTDAIEKLDRLDAQRSVLDPLLKRLHPRPREILRLRYWEDLTLEETGDRLGITRERVRQLENKALRKMGMPFSRKPVLHDPGPTITDRELRLRVGSMMDRSEKREKVMEIMRKLGCCTHGAARPHIEAAGLSISQPTFDEYRKELFPGQEPKRMDKPGINGHRQPTSEAADRINASSKPTAAPVESPVVDAISLIADAKALANRCGGPANLRRLLDAIEAA